MWSLKRVETPNLIKSPMSVSTYKPIATAITCSENDEDAMVMLGAYRELERDNAALRAALELLLHVRGTSEDTPEVERQARAALAAGGAK